MRVALKGGELSIPVAIRRPQSASGLGGTFVISLLDAATSPDIYERLRSAEVAFQSRAKEWKELVTQIGNQRSDPVLRWRLAEKIVGFAHRMRTAWGFDVVNLVDAVAQEIEMSRSALGYVLRLRERFTLAEVKASKMTWSRFQEVLDIREEALMRECVRLLREGQIRSDAEIREFKHLANAARILD